jgi:hypothetical protein
VHLQEIEARNWGLGDVGSLPGRQARGGRLARLQPARQLGQQLLGLSRHQVIDPLHLLGSGRHVGTAGHHDLVHRLGAPDDVAEGLSLDPHRGDHHDVCPVEVAGRELVEVQVHEPELPMAREQGGRGDQAQRGQHRTLPDEGQDILLPPVALRKSRPDQ